MNISADDLKLGPLQDNGGPTMTHALLPGSVAIDVIPVDACDVDEDQRGLPRPSGTMCDVGAFEVQEAGGITPISTMIPVGCCNNVSGCGDGRIRFPLQPRYELTVDPQGAVSPGASIAVALGGKAVISEGILDGLQGFVPGGVTKIDVVDLAATVQIRTGGTMPGVTLTNVPLPTTCLIGGTACDPANDGASVPGNRANTDCIPTAFYNPCRAVVSFPTSNDCAAGGVCETLGKAYQCDVNGLLRDRWCGDPARDEGLHVHGGRLRGRALWVG